MEYRHTQLGWVTISAIGVAIIVAMLVDSGTPQLNRSLGVILLAVALGLFYSLTVEIKDGALSCRFGIGIIRRRYLLNEIEKAQAVCNPWYAGWGIRWIPGQWVLWNVSGFQAVELTLKNGKLFRIGTDEPEALVQAIRTNQAATI